MSFVHIQLEYDNTQKAYGLSFCIYHGKSLLGLIKCYQEVIYIIYNNTDN